MEENLLGLNGRILQFNAKLDLEPLGRFMLQTRLPI